MSSLRTHRERLGLTQQQVADRAGVSRQLVGAVETGRHVPRVDAALAIATALAVDVAELFGAPVAPVDVLTGIRPTAGSLVRLGRIGDLIVTAPVVSGGRDWGAADAVVEGSGLVEFSRLDPGIVVAGCEPGLGVLESLLRERAMAAVAVTASSALAVEALSAGRVHAAVVHGAGVTRRRTPPGLDVARFGFTRWRVGLAGPPDAGDGWAERALAGAVPVVQREPGAAVQRSFLGAMAPGVDAVPGPVVATHLEAAQRAVLAGMAAVTIEPAALAAGASFHPIEIHTAQLWVDRRHLAESAVGAALDAITGRRFQTRLSSVGGYDLSGCGTEAA